jgi:hypothetical protein
MMITVLTGLLVVITGVYAFLTLGILRSNREVVAAMKTQVEAATRPYVVVLLERKRAGFYSFKVSNLGHSAAKGLRLKCDPEIKPVAASGGVIQVGKSPDASGLFRHSIGSVAPLQSVEALFGHYSGIKAAYPDLVFKVTVQYDGIDRAYEETMELSLKATDNVAHLGEYDVGDELHAIRETLDRIRAKLES